MNGLAGTTKTRKAIRVELIHCGAARLPVPRVFELPSSELRRVVLRDCYWEECKEGQPNQDLDDSVSFGEGFILQSPQGVADFGVGIKTR